MMNMETMKKEFNTAKQQMSVGANMIAALITAGVVGYYIGGQLFEQYHHVRSRSLIGSAPPDCTLAAH